MQRRENNLNHRLADDEPLADAFENWLFSLATGLVVRSILAGRNRNQRGKKDREAKAVQHDPIVQTRSLAESYGEGRP